MTMEEMDLTGDASLAKRKRSQIGSGTSPLQLQQGSVSTPGRHPPHKRPRRHTDAVPASTLSPFGLLPLELIQHILSFLDPLSLFRAYMACRTFNRVLHDGARKPPGYRMSGLVEYLPPDQIWRQVRERDISGMPKPMQNMTNRETLALAFCNVCQFCGKRGGSKGAIDATQWQPNTDDEVRVIWPLRIRSCATCLRAQLITENDIIFSDESFLKPGLASVLLTADWHFMPQHVIADSRMPHSIEVTKYYGAADFLSLKERLSQAQSAGSLQLREFLSSLADQRNARQNEVALFERWDIDGGRDTARLSLISGIKPNDDLDQRRSMSRSISDVTMILSSPAPLTTLASFATRQVSKAELPTSSTAPSDTVSMSSHRSSRSQRRSRDHAHAVAQKRAEIIRRCQEEMKPPIDMDILEDLAAFQAALMNSLPLTQSSWDTLKWRLQEQRDRLVSEIESKRMIKSAPIPGRYCPPQHTDEYILAHASMPAHQTLYTLAEDYIKQVYASGSLIDYRNAPRFAADVLNVAREQYMIQLDRLVNFVEAGFMDHGSVSQTGLTLGDMKRLFEQSIKSRTHQIRSDLFVCAVCSVDGAVRRYEFQPVIQHYLMKHLTSYATGPPKLDWRLEWPKASPFHPHPDEIRSPSPPADHTPLAQNRPLRARTPMSMISSSIPSLGRSSPMTVSTPIIAQSQSLAEAGSSNHHLQPLRGHNMYETQRRHMGSALHWAWGQVPSTIELPNSLRAYTVLSLAIEDFRRDFKNSPSVELLLDALNSRFDLDELKQMNRLRCEQCDLQAKDHKMRDLSELLNHYKDEHARGKPSTRQTAWLHDLVVLPLKAAVVSFAEDSDTPTKLRDVLIDAIATATTQTIHRQTPASDRPRSTVPSQSVYSGQLNNRSGPVATTEAFEEIPTYSQGPPRYLEREEYRQPLTRATIHEWAVTRPLTVSYQPGLSQRLNDQYHSVGARTQTVASTRHATSPETSPSHNIHSDRSAPRTTFGLQRDPQYRASQPDRSSADVFLSRIEDERDIHMNDTNYSSSRRSDRLIQRNDTRLYSHSKQRTESAHVKFQDASTRDQVLILGPSQGLAFTPSQHEQRERPLSYDDKRSIIELYDIGDPAHQYSIDHRSEQQESYGYNQVSERFSVVPQPAIRHAEHDSVRYHVTEVRPGYYLPEQSARSASPISLTHDGDDAQRYRYLDRRTTAETVYHYPHTYDH